MRFEGLIRASVFAIAALAFHFEMPAEAACQFSIASSSSPELSRGIASDGTNFLVGLRGDFIQPSDIGAQLVSPNGTLIGSVIQSNHTGNDPFVAFGGGQYLLAWTDDGLFPDDDVWGMFVSPTGVAGAPFPIAASAFDEALDGIAFDGTNFFVVYEVDQNSPPGRFIRGRLVDSTGTIVSTTPISTSGGLDGFHSVAFNGSKYLVAWTDDATHKQIRARSMTPAGTLGTEFLVNAASVPQDGGVGVESDGSNFLVVWSREAGGAGTNQWDVVAQRATDSAIVGSEIGVANWAGGQIGAYVAFDGSDYLVTWSEATNDLNQDGVCDPNEATGWDVSARTVSASGVVGAAPFGIVHDAGNQFEAPVAWNGTEFLVAWSDGTYVGGASGDVFGKLVVPNVVQPPAVYCTSKVNSLGCTPLVTWSGTPKIGNPAPFKIGATNELNNKNGLLFYSSVASNGAPFQGGVLCTKTPIKRTSLQNSAGNPPPNDCSGNYSFDFNAFIASGQDPALVAGQSVWAQNWSRDPGFSAPNNTGLTNAIAFTIAP